MKDGVWPSPAWWVSLPWQAANTWRVRRPRAPLPGPAIAIGSLAPGGRGKTPLTAVFAESLRARAPVVLHSGYRGAVRRSDPPVVLRGIDAEPNLLSVDLGDHDLDLAVVGVEDEGFAVASRMGRHRVREQT